MIKSLKLYLGLDCSAFAPLKEEMDHLLQLILTETKLEFEKAV